MSMTPHYPQTQGEAFVQPHHDLLTMVKYSEYDPLELASDQATAHVQSHLLGISAAL